MIITKTIDKSEVNLNEIVGYQHYLLDSIKEYIDFRKKLETVIDSKIYIFYNEIYKYEFNRSAQSSTKKLFKIVLGLTEQHQIFILSLMGLQPKEKTNAIMLLDGGYKIYVYEDKKC